MDTYSLGKKVIGNSRKNGKCHKDWKNREYHKKCWKELFFFNF